MRTVAVATSIPEGHAALWSPDLVTSGTLAEVAETVTGLHRAGDPVRWVVWAAHDLAALLTRGVPVARVWDCAEVHRLIEGGWRARPQDIVRRLGTRPGGRPTGPQDDLFDFGDVTDSPAAARSRGGLSAR